MFVLLWFNGFRSWGEKQNRKDTAMNNPIAKNKLFATLNVNEVAGIIAGLPEEHRMDAYCIYFGTVNMLSECVDAAIEVYNHKDAKEYPVVK